MIDFVQWHVLPWPSLSKNFLLLLVGSLWKATSRNLNLKVWTTQVSLSFQDLAMTFKWLQRYLIELKSL